MSAGLVVSFFLISLLDSLHIVSILVFLNILSALLLTLFSQKTRLKPFLVGVTSVVFMAMALMWVTKGWSHFGNFLLKRQWSGYQLLTHKDSIYGNIALAKKDSQLSFFNNGLLLYTIPDKQRAEESVHFALLEHPAPQNILLVGGGVAGLIEEILKHPVNKVDYIELDPLIIKIAKNYLAEEYRYPLEEPRVIINSLDGRLFIKTTKERYDCVILNLGDPCIAQLNRYYTVEFFQEVKRVLRKGGIIAFSVSSSENYLNRELRLYLKSIHASLEKVFKDIKVIPLDTAHFLAADEEDVLSYDYNLLTKRAKERRLDISYVREYYLFSKLSSQQIAHFEDSLKAVGDVKINYDLRPITYFYNTVFWTTYFRDSIFISFFKAIQKVSLGNIILVVLSIAVLFGLIFRNHPNFHRKSVILAILVMGFSQMVLQVIILLSFQFIYGYLFYRLGLVLTFFMVGLALGVLWITKIIKKIKEELAIFIRIQSGILIYALFLLLILFWLKNSKTEILYWLGANVVFLILPLMAGMLGGMHFPLANKIYLRGSAEVGRSGGIIYGVDLLGSSLGAFLSGIYLIPVLGITQTCFLVAIFNLLAVILLAFSYRLK
jgi:spermidine synthase